MCVWPCSRTRRPSRWTRSWRLLHSSREPGRSLAKSNCLVCMLRSAVPTWMCWTFTTATESITGERSRVAHGSSVPHDCVGCQGRIPRMHERSLSRPKTPCPARGSCTRMSARSTATHMTATRGGLGSSQRTRWGTIGRGVQIAANRAANVNLRPAGRPLRTSRRVARPWSQALHGRSPVEPAIGHDGLREGLSVGRLSQASRGGLEL